MAEALISLFILLVQIFLGIVFGILSVYLALRFFDKMTEGIDELAELKKGNIAVAIVLLSLVIGIGTIVAAGATQFEQTVTSGGTLPLFFISLVMAVIRLVIVILIAVIAIYVSLRVVDTLTVGIDELKEIKKGNIAVALEIAAVIYIISLVVSNSIEGIEGLAIFRPETLAALLGVQ